MGREREGEEGRQVEGAGIYETCDTQKWQVMLLLLPFLDADKCDTKRMMASRSTEKQEEE